MVIARNSIQRLYKGPTPPVLVMISFLANRLKLAWASIHIWIGLEEAGAFKIISSLLLLFLSLWHEQVKKSPNASSKIEKSCFICRDINISSFPVPHPKAIQIQFPANGAVTGNHSKLLVVPVSDGEYVGCLTRKRVVHQQLLRCSIPPDAGDNSHWWYGLSLCSYSQG